MKLKSISACISFLIAINTLSPVCLAKDAYILEAEKFIPGYMLSVSSNGTLVESDSVTWERYDTESDGWILVEKMTGNPCRISNEVSGKKIRASVNGTSSAEINTEAEISSPLKSNISRETNHSFDSMPDGGSVPELQPTEYVFDYNGNKYIVLDEDEENNEYMIMSSALGEGYFGNARTDGVCDPENTSNVIGYLNHLSLEGEVSEELTYLDVKPIDEKIAQYINKNRTWFVESSFDRERIDGVYVYSNADDAYTFKAGVSILSLSEFYEVYSRLGRDTIASSWLRSPGMGTNPCTRFNSSFATQSSAVATLAPILPVYYLSEDFFKNVCLDEDSVGSHVVDILKSVMSTEQMLELGYTKSKLVEWGLLEPGKPPVASNVEIKVEKAKPGYTAHVSYDYSDPTGLKEKNSEITWYVSYSELGTYTQIDDAFGNDWIIPNSCGNKFIKAAVLAKNEEGTTADSVVYSNAIKIDAPLVNVVNNNIPEDVDLTAEAYAFTFNSDKYQILDYETKNGQTTYFVVQRKHIAQGKFDVDGTNKFEVDDPDKNNVGYWLNHEVLAKTVPEQDTYKIIGGNGLFNWGNGMNDSIRKNIDTEHIWLTEGSVNGSAVGVNDYTFKAGIAILSANEYMKYIDRIGPANVSGGFVRTATGGTSIGSIGNASSNYKINAYDAAGIQLYKPCYWIKKDFFINNYVDPRTMGEEAKKFILATISHEEMVNASAEYTEADIVAFGYPKSVGYAENVMIKGAFAVGENVEAVYSFNDNSLGIPDGNNAIYQWYSRDSKDAEFKMISGANYKNYKITKDDVGKYLMVEVTPCDANGNICTKNSFKSNVAVRSKQDILAKMSNVEFSGNTVNLTVSVNSEVEADLILMACEYTSQDEMKIMNYQTIKTVPGNNSFGISIENVGQDNSIQLMVFDSFEKLHPLCVEDITR